MIRALVTKELRETAGIAAVALAVFTAYVTGRMGGVALFSFIPGFAEQPADTPFVEDGFQYPFSLIATAFAIALGFRQSAWEPSQGTSLYLLHRPISRKAIYRTKLLTGLSLLLVCTLLPILIYALWAATPGTHAGPFEWSMTGPEIHVWLMFPLIYLGAFASGIRPGRWFGSRLLPLAAVTLPALFATFAPRWWLTAFPVIVLTGAWFSANILLEADTRDY